jgi:hypothetical protein
MTRGIKSFRSGAILIALVLLGAAIFTMAAREQANLSASYSFLNAYDSNGAMLSPTPTAVVNDLSTSQLGAFNLGVGAEWTTVVRHEHTDPLCFSARLSVLTLICAYIDLSSIINFFACIIGSVLRY